MAYEQNQTNKTEIQDEFIVEASSTANDKVHAYVSSISKFTNSKGEKSLNVSPIMANAKITTTPQSIIIDQIKPVQAQLGYSCRYANRDMFDCKDYEEDDNTTQLLARNVIGSSQIYDFMGGTVQYEKSNEIKYMFLNFEFLMTYNILPFDYCGFGNTFEERTNHANVKVSRSSGKIQPAIYEPACGVYINSNNQGIITLLFLHENDETEEPLKYIVKTDRDGREYRTPSQFTTMQKGVSIQTFMATNPHIKFNISFENPLTQCSDIYDKYIRGNAQLEQDYAETNQYYQRKLVEYAENKIRPIFADIDEDRFNIQIYSL